MSRAAYIIGLMEQELPAAQQAQHDKMRAVIAQKRAKKTPKPPNAVINPNQRKPGQLVQRKMKTTTPSVLPGEKKKNEDLIDEVAARRTISFRGGSRHIRYKCPPGWKRVSASTSRCRCNT